MRQVACQLERDRAGRGRCICPGSGTCISWVSSREDTPASAAWERGAALFEVFFARPGDRVHWVAGASWAHLLLRSVASLRSYRRPFRLSPASMAGAPCPAWCICSNSTGGTSPIAVKIRSLLFQSTHSSAANSTSSRFRHGPLLVRPLHREAALNEIHGTLRGFIGDRCSCTPCPERLPGGPSYATTRSRREARHREPTVQAASQDPALGSSVENIVLFDMTPSSRGFGRRQSRGDSSAPPGALARLSSLVPAGSRDSRCVDAPGSRFTVGRLLEHGVATQRCSVGNDSPSRSRQSSR